MFDSTNTFSPVCAGEDLPTLQTRYTMVTKQKCLFFFVNDKPFKSLAEAQKHDLIEIIKKDVSLMSEPMAITPEQVEFVADFMLKNSSAIVDCLTTTPTSRARARKTNGATKAKKPKLQPANVNKEVLVNK